jgi:hypothetical protein
MTPLKRSLFAVLAVCALGGCASRPFAAFDDPRPNGRLSLRERSHCEVPDAPGDQPNWCDYPHEVRAFLDQREECDHFRGEPWPEGDDADAIARRKQLHKAMAKLCEGTDARLAELRTAYRDDAVISRVLAGFENEITP